MKFYRFLSFLLFPLIAIYILVRVLKGKEDKRRWKERFGYPGLKRPDGKVIWVNAVSVGEVNSCFGLISELLEFSSDISILLTTTTVTSAAIVVSKLDSFKGRVIHQFLPIDSYFCAKRFLDFWSPRAAIFIESEIWPNLIEIARKKAILSFLVNARMSERSLSRWLLAKKLGIKIFDYFAVIFVQKESDIANFNHLASQECLFYGNLKSQAQQPSVNLDELEKLKLQIGSRKVWLVSNTHKGEEEIVIAVHKSLKQQFPDLITILAPRHPGRAEEIKSLLSGLTFAQRSKKEVITDKVELYIADSLGELGIFYSLATFNFLGGSLVDVGGHNPYEPVKLGCCVVSGHKVFNSKDAFVKLQENNACILIESEQQLLEAVTSLLINPNRCKELSDNALKLLQDTDNIAKKIVTKIDQILMLRF